MTAEQKNLLRSVCEDHPDNCVSIAIMALMRDVATLTATVDMLTSIMYIPGYPDYKEAAHDQTRTL